MFFVSHLYIYIYIYIYIYTIFLFLLYPPRIAFANCGHKLCKLYLIWNKLVVVVLLLLLLFVVVVVVVEVHLELVTDRSTDTFLIAFRRYVSLRGNPNNCWFDCGTDFNTTWRNFWKTGIFLESRALFRRNFCVLFSGVGMFLAPVTRTELWRVSSNQYDKRWTLRPKTKPSQKISEKPM